MPGCWSNSGIASTRANARPRSSYFVFSIARSAFSSRARNGIFGRSVSSSASSFVLMTSLPSNRTDRTTYRRPSLIVYRMLIRLRSSDCRGVAFTCTSKKPSCW